MKSSQPRLPKFVEYGPQGVSGELTRIRFRSDPLSGGKWCAELRVGLDAPRPTPQLDELDICFEPNKFLKGLGSHWSLLPHAHGALLCCQQDQALELFHLALINVGALYFRLELQPIVTLVTGPGTHLCYPDNIAGHIQAALPVTPCPRRTAWRLHNATLFKSFIDVGWNLPIPRAPGAFQLKEDQGDLVLNWSAEGTPSNFSVPIYRIDDELQAALHAYEEQRAPATSSLLSAASMGDAHGAWLAMQMTAAAAKRGDLNTLRVLRVTHQRAVERGRREIGTIASLIGASAALGDLKRAIALIPVLESRIGADLKIPATAGWVGAHVRNLLVVRQRGGRDFRSIVTPAGGVEPLGTEFDEELYTPLPAALQTERPEVDLSFVERARLSTRLQPAHEHAKIRTANREPGFALARKAFASDDDKGAWSLIQQAAANKELVDSEETGTMVLRLIAKFSDDIADAVSALQAIHQGRVSCQLYARASQQLSEKLISLGRLEEALGVLQRALVHVPDSVLLLVAHAKVLGVASDPAAVDAWKQVLAHPSLESFEAHGYRKELAELLKSMDQHTGLLDDLRALHLQDAGNVQLTHQLASLLEERAAIDEAVIVRSRHAASVAGLKGYPSVALLVQAVNADGITCLQGALAAAQAIHLATSIAHPAAWLQRAVLKLAERFDDPLILEYALEAAHAVEDTTAVARLLGQLGDATQTLSPAPAPHDLAPSPQVSMARPALYGAHGDHGGDDNELEDHNSDDQARHLVLDTSQLPVVLESFEALYPRVLFIEDELELQSLSNALAQGPASKARAELLGRRAVLLLQAGLASGAAQAWTGAMILQPDDLRALAGLSVARSLSNASRSGASSFEHFLEEIERRTETTPESLPEPLLRIAALIG